MRKLAFALIVLIDGQQQEVSYWADILRCNQFSEWVEHGHTYAKEKRYKKRNSQVNITAYCKPVFVNANTKLLD